MRIELVFTSDRPKKETEIQRGGKGVKMKLKRGVIPVAIIGALLVSLFAPMAVSANESPVLPTSFYGDVTVNDTAALVDTVITARIVDAVGSPGEGTITVTEEGKYGVSGLGSKLSVLTDSLDDVGKEIEFYVQLPGWPEAQKADPYPTATYDSDTHQVNLNVVMDDVVPPTVTIDIPDYINTANEASVPVTITSDEDGTYSYTISDGTVAHDVTGTDSITGGVDVELSVDLSGLDEVSVTADASVDDAAGNTGDASTDTATKDTTAPTATLSPEDIDTGVAIDATVSATFDEDVTAVDLSGITITGATSVSPTLDEVTDTITIAHDAFALDTSYTVTIPAGAVNDLAGNPNALYTWSFTTGAVDTTPPTVVSTTPAADAPSVAIDATVSATFSEGIEEGTNFGDITISGATGVSATIDGATLTIAHGAFAYETSYTVTIPAGAVKDLAGNPLAEAKVWSFTVVTEEGAFDPYIYDEDEDGELSKDETLAAVDDYLAENITKDEALAVVKVYFS